MGKNLCAQLRNIRDGKARNYAVQIEEIFEYDIDSTPEELELSCREADFVFNLAGVNRPKETSEFMAGNFGFASTLLDTLKKHGNKCPIMLSSSQQASLTGRFGNSEYGRSKKAGEDLFLEYEREFLQAAPHAALDAASPGDCGSSPAMRDQAHDEGLRPRVLIYRFPNLFGKWCRPNYNSAVATFCNAVANDLPYTVNDPSVELELLYIDDLVEEMIACLQGKEHRCEFEGLEVIPTPHAGLSETLIAASEPQSPASEGILTPHAALDAASPGDCGRRPAMRDQACDEGTNVGRYCYVPTTHKATLGEIVNLLNQFEAQRTTLVVPEIPDGSFAKKLYSTFLSYLPKEKMVFKPKVNDDYRGSFIEILKTKSCGQFSINISKPGITRGQHWHNSKWEIFAVVSGHGLIQERREGDEEVISFEVTGEEIKAIQMLPGYTHNIINLSETEPLVTFMWANEQFDPNKPDTYYDPVE